MTFFNPITGGSALLNVVEAMAFPPGHLADLTIDYVNASTVKITVGTHSMTARLPHGTIADQGVDVTVSADISASLAAPVGIGGLDQGIEAPNSAYQLWLLAKAGGIAPGLMWILDGGPPAVWPADYDYRVYLATFYNRAGGGGDLEPFASVVLSPNLEVIA